MAHLTIAGDRGGSGSHSRVLIERSSAYGNSIIRRRAIIDGVRHADKSVRTFLVAGFGSLH
jgi:hypothetical protein